MTTHRYHTALVVLHWLLGFMILLGLIMGTFSLERLPNSQPEKLDSLRGHVINGLAIGVLMIVRLIVRSLTRRPAPPSTGFSWTKRAGQRVHLSLYFVVLLMVASGLALALETHLPSILFSQSAQPLPGSFDGFWARTAHAILAKLLMALILLHVGAALWHHYILRDGLLKRSKRVGKSSCPLTQTVSDDRSYRRPAMRQQVIDAAGRVCCQALEDVAQVLIRVMPVELGRLNQTHRSGRTLATA
jgi:cytochrome b561